MADYQILIVPDEVMASQLIPWLWVDHETLMIDPDQIDCLNDQTKIIFGARPPEIPDESPS